MGTRAGRVVTCVTPMRYAETTQEGWPRISRARHETQPRFEYGTRITTKGKLGERPRENSRTCGDIGVALASLALAWHSRQGKVRGDLKWRAMRRDPMGSVWSTAWDAAEEAPLVNSDVPRNVGAGTSKPLTDGGIHVRTLSAASLFLA
ncbi:hypothetical protein MRX96_056651 [Rhipicephalus microplus]